MPRGFSGTTATGDALALSNLVQAVPRLAAMPFVGRLTSSLMILLGGDAMASHGLGPARAVEYAAAAAGQATEPQRTAAIARLPGLRRARHDLAEAIDQMIAACQVASPPSDGDR
jgi:hypothetical protein